MGRPKLLSDEAVLEIARDVFSREGHSVSTRQLASSVGLSQAALIQRFGSKEALFCAAMLPQPLDPQALKKAAKDGGFTELAVVLVRQVSSRIPVVLRLASNPDAEPEVIASAHEKLQVKETHAVLRGLVAQMQQEGSLNAQASPNAIVDALLVAAHGFTLMRLSGTAGEVPVDTVRRFANTLANQQKD